MQTNEIQELLLDTIPAWHYWFARPFILRAVGNGQRFCAEMLQQVFQKSIWKTVFIGPSPVTEDALKLFGICIFDLPESLNNSYANIF